MKRWWMIILFSISLIGLQAQILVQLERYNDPKTDKYLPGSQLIIKQKAFPDVWSKKTISQILVNENTIVFEDLIIPLDDIIGVRYERPFVKGLSKKLYQFGFAWLAYAGLLQALNRFEIGRDTFVVAGSAFTLGFGLKTLFFRRTFTIGKNSRLRILDLNMYNSNFD